MRFVSLKPLIDPVNSAIEAGLVYITDDVPGIRRVRRGKGFSYVGLDGRPIRDPEELARFRALAIPPAWTQVWIAPDACAHLQATGRDAKGRKQYRYHPVWGEQRSQAKYTRLILFCQVLPAIRARVEQDLGQRGLPRTKVLATMVRLLELTYIRIGNEEYARENESFGLTTLRDGHTEISGARVRFHFRGKSGQHHDIEVRDRRLARIVKQCRDLPGQQLFQYVDDDGTLQQVDSGDVNDYLRAITGQEFTAKDFRTWGGTLLAARALKELGPQPSDRASQKSIVQAVGKVANMLGNRPATCRKYYVHPAIIDAYLDGSLFFAFQAMSAHPVPNAPHDLDVEEAVVLELLRERLIDFEVSQGELP